MNKELLKTLDIDDSLGLRELKSKLEEKQLEYLERAQSTADDSRREELESIVEDIEKEIAFLTDEISKAGSALVFDDGGSDDAVLEEKEDKPDEVSSKVEAIRKRNEEKRQAQPVQPAPSAADSSPQQNAAPVNTPPVSRLYGYQSGSPAAYSRDLSGGMQAFKNKDYDVSLSIFRDLSNAGDVDAMFMQAHQCFEGLGCDKDWDRFEFWMKSAADKGNVSAKCYLAEKYLKHADNRSPIGSKQAQKVYKEAIKILEEAADTGDAGSMKLYVSVAEMLYNGVYEEQTVAIRQCLSRRNATKAMSYCDKLSQMETDQFEKKNWLERKKYLSKKRGFKADASGKPVKAPKQHGGCHIGCGTIILGIVALYLISMVISVLYVHFIGNKKLDKELKEQGSSKGDETIVVLEEPFGTKNESLTTFPEDRILANQQVTTDLADVQNEYNYSIDGESWGFAYVFRAGNGNDLAYMDFDLDKKFSAFTFKMTPLLGHDVWTTNAQVQVTDLDTGEIIYDYVLEEGTGVADVTVNIEGCDNIRLSAYAMEGGDMFARLSYVMVKNGEFHVEPVTGDEAAEEAPAEETE